VLERLILAECGHHVRHRHSGVVVWWYCWLHVLPIQLQEGDKQRRKSKGEMQATVVADVVAAGWRLGQLPMGMPY
jgi:hypothetical protein